MFCHRMLPGKKMPYAANLLVWAIVSVQAQSLTAPQAGDMKVKAELRKADDSPRIWITPEYVHYWQNTTAKLPELLSVTDMADLTPIGNFYGNKGIAWNDGNGAKLTIGAWIDEEKRYGIELTGFYIPKQTQSASFNPLPGNVDAFFTDTHFGQPPIIFRNFFPVDPASHASFQYSTMQYGGEANGLVHLKDWQPTEGLKIEENILAGFRYFGLQDSYSDQYVQPTGGILPPPPIGFAYNDNFKTDNNFYGANLGVHVRLEYKRFFAEITPKVALGLTDESVGVNGSNAVVMNPGPGGFYASGNKLGHRTNDTFAYLPQITVKLGYDFNDTVEAFVGYDALYLSEVARVENQISTQLDGNQIAGINFVPGGPPDGSPAPTVQSSSLFEQGVTAGITFKL